MKVYVWSKQMFDKGMADNGITDQNVEERDKIMFISITDTAKFSNSRIPYFKEDHDNVMNLSFDDVEHDLQPSPTQPEGTKAFTEEQAEKLFQFIKRNRDKETCIVHCMAGISRSGAVGTFINGYCGGDWEEFKRTNPYILPNGRVERLLNRAKYRDNE
jgi:predicted protein tyrosine phosphatase